MTELLGNTKSITLSSITILGRTVLQKPVFNATASFQNNDLLVTVASAQYINSKSLAPYAGLSGSATSGPCAPTVLAFTYPGSTPYFPGNHRTVSSPSLNSISQTVLANIQSLAQK
jgi:hypothetical protein